MRGVLIFAALIVGCFAQPAPAIATLHDSIGGSSGGQIYIVRTDLPSIPDISTVTPNLSNKVSAITVHDLNYIVQVCDGLIYSGKCWAFRHSYTVPDLRKQDMNDKIKSVKSWYVGLPTSAASTNCGVTLFQDSDYKGRSSYVGPGSYGDIRTAAWNGWGAFSDNSLSSLILIKGTRVKVYKDYNLSGTLTTYYCYGTIAGLSDYCRINVSTHDQASSLVVECMDPN